MGDTKNAIFAAIVLSAIVLIGCEYFYALPQEQRQEELQRQAQITQVPPAQIPACAANAPGSSLGSNVGCTRFETACAPAHSRQSDRRGSSAQCPNHGRLPAVPLG